MKTLETLKNMVAQSLAAVNSLSNSVNQPQQHQPSTYNMATPLKPPAEAVPVLGLNEHPDLGKVSSPFNKPPASPSVDTPPGMSQHTGAAAAGVPGMGPTPDPWAQYGGSAVPPPARQGQCPFAVPQKSVPTVSESMGPQ